jgi:uncharacterized membrane protein HdeD (DUF308 family)
MLSEYMQVVSANRKGEWNMRNAKKLKTVFVVMSILYVLLGITLIIWPEMSALTLCKLFGTIILILGIIKIIGFFRSEAFINYAYLDQAQGILYIILGSLMLVSPKAVISALPLMLGIVIIIDSSLRFQLALNLKRLMYEKWWIYLGIALITAVLGVLLLFNPFKGSIILTIYIGISLTVNGVFNLLGIMYIKKIFNLFKGRDETWLES